MLEVTASSSSQHQHHHQHQHQHHHPTRPASPTKGVRPATGLFNTSESNRTSVLNGSHRTLCTEDDRETVLVFPDFKVVTEVHRSHQGAQELWDTAVDPSVERDGRYIEKSRLKTWILPYACVILLCAPFRFAMLAHSSPLFSQVLTRSGTADAELLLRNSSMVCLRR